GRVRRARGGRAVDRLGGQRLGSLIRRLDSLIRRLALRRLTGEDAMTIRMIIADDEALMRSGLRLVVGAADDIEIIAEAADGAEAIDLTHRLGPDLVLMDIRMPVIDGLEAAQRLLSEPGHPQILMLTAFGTDDFVHRA